MEYRVWCNCNLTLFLVWAVSYVQCGLRVAILQFSVNDKFMRSETKIKGNVRGFESPFSSFRRLFGNIVTD